MLPGKQILWKFILVYLLFSIVSGCSSGGSGSTNGSSSSDFEPPSTPTGLTADVVSVSVISLNWTASTDNVGVAGYKIYRNGTEILTTSTASYTDRGLSLETEYVYQICAYDAAGTDSAMSEAVTISISSDTDTEAVNIPLHIKETIGINRVNEMVHNGIPVSKKHEMTTKENLIVEDSDGTQIPATFEVLSRWAGGVDDSTKSIQWLLVSFPATVGANTTENYVIKTGTPIDHPAAIEVINNSDDFTVNTGVAEFIISKNELTLFNSISRDGTTVLANNGGSNSTINDQDLANANAPRSIVIERNNEHYVCIKVEGDYANTPVGPRSAKPLSYKIRYEFYAGSPTVVVNHKFFWSGYDGDNAGRPSGTYNIIVDNVSLSLPDMVNYTSTDIFADASTHLSGSLSDTQTASVAQRRRTLFTDSHAAEVNHGAQSVSTEFASQPMLINSSANGVVAVTIDHMDKFEPQSIDTDHNGKITLNVMAEGQYFASMQGTWARVGISALPAGTTYDTTLTVNYAPVNNRLFAFPTAEYTADSKVFLELPSVSGALLNGHVTDYYNNLQLITENNLNFMNEENFQGLMTWGTMTGYPSLLGDQPGWDKIFEGAWNTDYHNAMNNVVKHFALDEDPSKLYDLAFMGARRMLHTQIIQPDWEASSEFMGWGYAGYGMFRSDGNSSHSYFENLFNYYYLTGDMEVIDILKIGGETKRSWHTRDQDGSLNDPETGGVDWVDCVDRRAMQSAAMFNFLGHTYDKSYLDDYKHIFNHAFSRSLVLLQDGSGNEYGFISTNQDVTSGFQSEQIWMVSLYFMDYLYSYFNEWGDVEISTSNIHISRVFEAVAKGFVTYVNQQNNDWDQDWFNQFRVNYSGNKIGGTLISIEGTNTQGNPSTMYNSGKFPVITLILRAGEMNGNSELNEFGISGIEWAVGYHEFVDSGDSYWGKVSALLYNRLHSAMFYTQ